MATLTAQGFTAGTVSNGSSSYTTVQYGTGADDDATTVAATLGDVTPEADDALAAGHIRVTLGRGYQPPSAQTTPTPAAPAAGNQDNGIPVSSNNSVPCVD